MLRLILIIFVSVLLLLAAALGYFFAAYPRVGPLRDVRVARTPERIERGRYLSEHVVGCVSCHGQRDWTRYSAPLQLASAGRGGYAFPLPFATIAAPNITPAAMGSWSDGELIRAMTEGVSRDGRPLFPIMPYENYRVMATDDVEAIVAYVRTLSPIAQTAVVPPVYPFPLNLIVRTMPAPATPQARPDPSDRVAYGKYVATIASCAHCHTRHDDRGQALEGMTFAGGERFVLPSGQAQHSANITPDKETGIGSWTEEAFVERFKMWAQLDDRALTEAAANGNTEMPWRDYAGMTREDLGAIYAYLRTVPAVRHTVPKP